MQDIFKIYIDRLSTRADEIAGEADPLFLQVEDGRLLFREPVRLTGSAYLAEEHLILHLEVATSYVALCKVCNEEIYSPFLLHGLYITEELANVSSKMYDFSHALRDAILLEIPLYMECDGNCPDRENLHKFLKTSPGV